MMTDSLVKLVWTQLAGCFSSIKKLMNSFLFSPAKILVGLLVFLEGKLTAANHGKVCQVFICFRTDTSIGCFPCR